MKRQHTQVLAIYRSYLTKEKATFSALMKPLLEQTQMLCGFTMVSEDGEYVAPLLIC